MIAVKGSSNYYSVLGVNKDASAKSIKKAYRELALKYHPDKAQDLETHKAEERFKKINEAYSILSDPGKRARYDRWGKQGLNGLRGNGTIVYSPFSTSRKSKREIIENKIDNQQDFNIDNFANDLGVKTKNLLKVIQKLIEKQNIQAEITNQWLRFD